MRVLQRNPPQRKSEARKQNMGALHKFGRANLAGPLGTLANNFKLLSLWAWLVPVLHSCKQPAHTSRLTLCSSRLSEQKF
eukprot:scaffold145687_cov23-Tisochrysis_lutea.AAC.3